MREGITTLDWVRMAAFIDGEGCIRIARIVRYGKPDGRPSHGKEYLCYALELVIGSTDIRLPSWCMATFGGSMYSDPRSTRHGRKDNYNRQDFWSWNCGTKRAEWILRGCLPYFLIKREQAEVALTFRDTYRIRTYGNGKGAVDVAVVSKRETAYQRLKELKKVTSIDERKAS